MPNNFRFNASAYISKAGHDSNSGTAKDAPKKTITSNIAGATSWVIGAGVYNVTAGTIMPVGAGLKKADGYVIIDAMGTAVNISVTAPHTIDGFHFKNFSNIQAAGKIFLNCVFQDSTFALIDNNAQLSSSKIINCTSTLMPRTYLSCVIIGSIVIQAGAVSAATIKDLYLDRNSVFSVLIGMPPSLFRNNNIQGILIIGGSKYAIKDLFADTPQDNGYATDVFWLTEANLTANGYTGTIVGWDTAAATCINRDPRFNDVSKLDFTLKADSPHIGRASDGVSNIGGTAYAQSFYAGTSNPNLLLLQPSANIDTSNNNDWKLQPGEIEGTIRAIAKVANTTEVITKLPYIGNKSFNSDDTGGSSTNFNVPDSKPVTSAYPDYRTTSGVASDLFRVVIAGHGYAAGVWLKVDGQYREVTSVTTDELIFNDAVRGIVGTGTPVQVGTLSALTSLNPNRLNYLMRSSLLDIVDSTNWDDPLTWDNNGLADSGQYLAQEWDNQPLIDNLNKVGFGDDNFDPNFGNPIQVKYIDIMIYLRNNYRS